MSQNNITGPSWDNSDEYSSIECTKLKEDLKQSDKLIEEIKDISLKVERYIIKSDKLTPPEANTLVPLMQQTYKLHQQAIILLANIHTFASCIVSVDGKNEEAKLLSSKINNKMSVLSQACTPLELIISKTSNDIINKYLADPEVKLDEFQINRIRMQNNYILSSKEEDLIIALGVNGFDAWATLYGNISGLISCSVNQQDGTKKEFGLAAAAALLEDTNRDIRKDAFNAINTGWNTHKETCAAILNSLSGTRHEINKRRSHSKPLHFLGTSLYKSRISKNTLDSIMTAVHDSKHLGQKTLKLQAKVLGIDKLGPWDRFVPAPNINKDQNEEKIPFNKACDIITESFSGVHPEMADFVQMMIKNKWIEGSVSDAKRPGAYCTKFYKSRNPRVYMTYTGGMKDVITLAHELGHAFHNWKLKELPRAQSVYPLTLAETASIFAETTVNEALANHTNSREELFKIQWGVSRESEGILLNVAARFTFEKEMYEKRKDGILSSKDLSNLMTTHWENWYGDSLSEMDPLFWCSKLHFHKSNISFYNYPYIFGLLFALGVYAQKDKLGDDFYPAYIDLLKDTGRMTAEEVAAKHLNADLEDTKFWTEGINIIGKKVAAFEDSVNHFF